MSKEITIQGQLTDIYLYNARQEVFYWTGISLFHRDGRNLSL